MDITLRQAGNKYEIRNENRLIAVLVTREAASSAMSLLLNLQRDVEANEIVTDGVEVEAVQRESHINLFDSHRFHFDEPRTR